MRNPDEIPTIFRRERMKPGDILHVHGNTWMSRRICNLLGSKGSHDAMIIRNEDRKLAVGESLFGRGGVETPLEEYERAMAWDGVRASVLRIPCADAADREAVARWFVLNVIGSPYDGRAIWRILLKSLFGGVSKKAAGWEFAWYCTEGVQAAWGRPGLSANFDVWAKANPTPKTTEKRLANGLLIDVSCYCLTEAGMRANLFGTTP